jgi:hypothetical protein
MRSRTLVAGFATVTALALSACDPAAAPLPARSATVSPSPVPQASPGRAASPTTPPSAVVPVAPRGTATALLATLTVKGRAPTTGYSRSQFGPAWADVDRNGCDTRNDVLARDLANETFKAGTRNCVVLSGWFTEPYSGRTVTFRRGAATSSLVQIDHVVALGDAWQSGAQQWAAGRRLGFANDPLNLLAADGGLNGRKGASNAASWLPPNKAFRCAYVARQVAVKAKYDLWVTPAERSAIATVLSTCPGRAAPA